MQVEMTGTLTVSLTLKDVLLCCNLKVSSINRGLAYGCVEYGRSSHWSVNTNYQQRTKSIVCALFGAFLDLCLQDSSKSCHCVKDALSLAIELASLIYASTKQLLSSAPFKPSAKLEKIAEDAKDKPSRNV